MIRYFATAAIAACFLASNFSFSSAKEANRQPPKVGEKAANFKLDTMDGKSFELDDATKKSPIVLVVLRGYPGYQCGICSKQVGDLMSAQEEIAKLGAKVVMVYPGPTAIVDEKAKEFFAASTLPDHFTVVVDPDLKFVNDYHLRWDQPKETAYPTTMIISKGGEIKFVDISSGHGGRTTGKMVVAALEKLN